MRSRKIISLALAALASLSLLCSCSEKDIQAPVGMKKASNDAAGYIMYVPDEWVVNEASGITSATAGQATNTTVSAAKVTNTTDAMDAVAYFEQYKSQFTTVMNDFMLQGDPVDDVVDTLPAKRFTYTGTVSDKLRKYSMVIVPNGKDVYILTFTSTKEEYDMYYDNFVGMVETFDIQ